MRGVYQIMSENKKKIAYWMTPTMIAEIQSFVDEGFSSSKGEFVPADKNVELPDDYVSTIKTIVRNKIRYCKGVLETDYFRRLFK